MQRLSGAYWTTIDTVLMGRRTYDVAREWTGAYPSVTNYVFSRTLTEDPEPDVHLVRDDAVRFVADLKARPGKGICVMGGGIFARPLLEAGLIDRVGVNVHPILLGGGIPLFHPLPSEIALELERFEPVGGGCLYASYRVRGRSTAGDAGDPGPPSTTR